MTNICKTNNDIESLKKLIKATSFNFTGLCITSLSDLNIMGHQRNKIGYTKVLKGFDNSIPLIAGSLRSDDLLIITSDLGNDPTYTGNDHTREKVPVLIFNSALVVRAKYLICNHFVILVPLYQIILNYLMMFMEKVFREDKIGDKMKLTKI